MENKRHVYFKGELERVGQILEPRVPVNKVKRVAISPNSKSKYIVCLSA